MNKKPDLRRFSERRHSKRKEAALRPIGTKRHRRRLTLVVRTTVLSGVTKRLDTTSAAFELSRSRLIGNILEWYVSQPELIQRVAAGQYQFPPR